MTSGCFHFEHIFGWFSLEIGVGGDIRGNISTVSALGGVILAHSGRITGQNRGCNCSTVLRVDIAGSLGRGPGRLHRCILPSFRRCVALQRVGRRPLDPEILGVDMVQPSVVNCVSQVVPFVVRWLS